jgi:Zn-dependent protease with chaperone function
MFAARCIGVSLAIFVLLYVVLSFLVFRGWKFLLRASGTRSPRAAADLLFALRILPFAVSVIVTVMFTVPSFLMLEPRSTNESIGVAPMILGLCCLLLLSIGGLRAYQAQWRTSRTMQRWVNESVLMDESGLVPVFQTGVGAPGFTVSGVCAPKVFVSEAAVSALNPSELRTALRHEMAHVRCYDNLKKMIFRMTAFPGLTSLERTWSEQSEMAADDAAVFSRSDALDLAAALIKVSRLGNPQHPSELIMTLLHSSTAFNVRIHRLFLWDGHLPSSGRTTQRWYVLPLAAGTTFSILAIYGSILTQMHNLTEWLVR